MVAGITPFNFPVMIPLWMSPVAIATGNTFILKPPGRDPGAGMFLAELWKKAGLPDGVFNVVHGDRDVIGRLLTHPDVDAISFVGATTTAKIIFETGDQARQARPGARRGQEPRAGAGRRRPGHARSTTSSRPPTVRRASGAWPCRSPWSRRRSPTSSSPGWSSKAKQVKVGPGTAPDVDMGPVISEQARARITGLIDSAEAEGAEILVDGRGHVVEGYESGCFLGPTIVDKVNPEMTINKEEVFGPTLEVIRVTSLEEGIELINANPYGNGTAIFTSSGEAARTFTRAVQVGMVGVNVPIPVPVAWHSFGGWKESLVGETHIYGPEGVKFYTRGKVVTQRWPEPVRGGVVPLLRRLAEVRAASPAGA